MAVQAIQTVDPLLLLEKFKEQVNPQWLRDNCPDKIEELIGFARRLKYLKDKGALRKSTILEPGIVPIEFSLELTLGLEDGELVVDKGGYTHTLRYERWVAPKKTMLEVAMFAIGESTEDKILKSLIREINSAISAAAKAFVTNKKPGDCVFKGMSHQFFNKDRLIQDLASYPTKSFGYSSNTLNFHAVATEELRNAVPYWHEVLLEFVKEKGTNSTKNLVSNSYILMDSAQQSEFLEGLVAIYKSRISKTSLFDGLHWDLSDFEDQTENLPALKERLPEVKSHIRLRLKELHDEQVTMGSDMSGDIGIYKSLLECLDLSDRRSYRAESLFDDELIYRLSDTIYVGTSASKFDRFNFMFWLSRALIEHDYQVNIVLLKQGDESVDLWLEDLKSTFEVAIQAPIDLNKFEAFADNVRRTAITGPIRGSKIDMIEFA